MAKNEKHRSWIFTTNNYTDEDKNNAKRLNHKYLVYGLEVGEEKHTPHLQGYVQLKNPMTFDALNKHLQYRARIQVAKGSAAQNRTYCTKSGNFEEYGTVPSQGKRNDLNKIKEMVKQGTTMKEVCLAADTYQTIRFAETLLKYCEKPRNFKTYVYWFYGPTGTGKSRLAEEMFPDAYWCMDTNKWWEGYDGHKTVIINDMRGDFCKFHVLLNILDRYPFRVEVKGGSRQLLADTIIITTCKHPSELFLSRTDEDVGQLLRRIDNILFFGDGTEHGTEVMGNIYHNFQNENRG